MQPHPMRFAPDHPLVERVRKLCMRPWDLVEELLDASYRRVALVRQRTALDADPVVPVAD